MILNRVKLSNFRNLEKIDLAISPQINIFLGRNGQGKTNLLEALSYLALGRSHRGSRDRELIRFGAEGFHVTVEGRSGSGESFQLETGVTREGRKRIRIDGQTVDRQSDLVGHLSAVQFDPGEVELTKGSPDHRRRFLDYTLSVSSAEYFRHLVAYRRAVAQKNRLLKLRYGASDAELDVWDAELVRTGLPLLIARRASLDALDWSARTAYEELAPGAGEMALSIRSTVAAANSGGGENTEEDLREEFERTLRGAREQERRMGHALVGPHRDRLEVALRDRSIRRYGSQGEMRTASIALKLAQGELIFQRTRERPAVFLDDIFSELDRIRTEALQSRLHREHQLFIATARTDHVMGMRDWPGLKVWLMEGGRLTPVEDLARVAGRLGSLASEETEQDGGRSS